MRWSRGRGALPFTGKRHRNPTKGTLTMEGTPDRNSPFLFTRWTENGGLGGLSERRARRKHASFHEGSRQECQRLGLLARAGRKHPRYTSSDGPAEATPSAVKHPRSPVLPCGAQTPRGVHAARAAERAGSERGTGTRHLSSGRSRSVASSRFHHRGVARPHGAARALARRKLFTSSDTRPERRNGEPVRV